jgi:hypothetical protein
MTRFWIKTVHIFAVGVLCILGLGSWCQATAVGTLMDLQPLERMDSIKFTDWLLQWETNILAEASHNYLHQRAGRGHGLADVPAAQRFLLRLLGY